jgi:hypothetical protein
MARSPLKEGFKQMEEEVSTPADLEAESFSIFIH